MKTWEEALNSKEPEISPEEDNSRFNGIGYNDRVKIQMGIEKVLRNANSYCLPVKKLMFGVMQDSELKDICMQNHSGVSTIIDDMISSGKIDEAAYINTGLVVLSPDYSKQFKNPEIIMCQGANMEASQARKGGRYLISEEDISSCTGVDDFLKKLRKGDFGYTEKDAYDSEGR